MGERGTMRTIRKGSRHVWRKSGFEKLYTIDSSYSLMKFGIRSMVISGSGKGEREELADVI